MGKVLVCDSIHEDGITKMKEAGLEVDYKPGITPEELLSAVGEYDALVVRSRTKVGKDVIAAAKRLKIIGRAGVGIDNIDVDEANKQGIRVERSPPGPSTAVAELVMGLMIGLVRNIPLADKSMKEGMWIKKSFMGSELSGKTLGIVGLGRIGSKVAKRAKAFEMNVIAFTPYPDESLLKELGVKTVSLSDLLKSAYFVTLHVPLTTDTHHMIGEKELRMMKRSAYLINTSRGPVVDNAALAKALREGWIAGAALDCYEVEPPVDATIVSMPNVVCTPHIGAQTLEAQRANAIIIAEKIVDALVKT